MANPAAGSYMKHRGNSSVKLNGYHHSPNLDLYSIYIISFYSMLNPNAISQFFPFISSAIAINLYQFIVILVLISFLASSIIYDSKKALPLPSTIIVTIAWFILSATWAIAPLISLRRTFFLFILIYTFFHAGTKIGSAKLAKAIVGTILSVCVINYVAVAIGIGTHTVSDFEGSLAGEWKGSFAHKNAAGAFFAPAILFLFWYPYKIALWKRAGIITFLLFFLLKTGAKVAITTSLFCTFALVPLFIMLERRTFFIGMIVIYTFLTLYAYQHFDILDRRTLTGRGEIWLTLLPFAMTHFWLGVGYGSFWQLGSQSVILFLAPSSSFMTRLTEGHNGFLDIFVTTGVVGLVLATVSAYILPFWRATLCQDPRIRRLCFAIIIQSTIQNFTESIMYTFDFPSWIFVVAVWVMIASANGRGPKSAPKVGEGDAYTESH